MEIGMYEGRLVGQISRMKNGQKENRELGNRQQEDRQLRQVVSKELGARAGAGIGRKEAAYVGDWA